MDVRLPNGAIIKNVPEGISKSEVQKRAIQAGIATAEDFGVTPSEAPEPTVPQVASAINADIVGLPGAGGEEAAYRVMEENADIIKAQSIANESSTADEFI